MFRGASHRAWQRIASAIKCGDGYSATRDSMRTREKVRRRAPPQLVGGGREVCFHLSALLACLVLFNSPQRGSHAMIICNVHDFCGDKRHTATHSAAHLKNCQNETLLVSSRTRSAAL